MLCIHFLDVIIHVHFLWSAPKLEIALSELEWKRSMEQKDWSPSLLRDLQSLYNTTSPSNMHSATLIFASTKRCCEKILLLFRVPSLAISCRITHVRIVNNRIERGSRLLHLTYVSTIAAHLTGARFNYRDLRPIDSTFPPVPGQRYQKKNERNRLTILRRSFKDDLEYKNLLATLDINFTWI